MGEQDEEVGLMIPAEDVAVMTAEEFFAVWQSAGNVAWTIAKAHAKTIEKRQESGRTLIEMMHGGHSA